METLQRPDGAAVDGGFREPVFQAQVVFRAAMEALSRPGRVVPLTPACMPPAPLSPEAGALALMLCDADTTVWLDKTLRSEEAVAAWLGFHTGARQSDYAADADFAFFADGRLLPSLDGFGQGTQDYPDRSTTLIVQVESLSKGTRWQLSGPGIEMEQALAVKGLPDLFPAQWRVNSERFPRGVDLILVAAGGIVGLPRTTRIRDREE